MANNQTTRRKRDIKTKLMAAVCMLLVSSIMMVSTTYAWFTLSTAPEVKGITTAVGANGNLEMALLPKSGLLTDISSAAGDSTRATEARNVTWGNLVDLSDSTIYGLDQITLFPSALNLGEDGKTLKEAFLKTPTYGADGRVDKLEENTFTGYYNTDTGSFAPDNYRGVRAVGTASGMTDRQLDYRNARSAGNNATAYAKTLASQSLNTNGSALANIAIAHGLAEEDEIESYTVTDVIALKTIVNDLQTKILPEIETAYKQYILAYAASAVSNDDIWTAVKTAVNSGKTLAEIKSAAGSYLPASLNTAISKYEATAASVDEALNGTADEPGGLNALDTTTDVNATFTWEQISVPMQKLANTSAMKLNGSTVSQVMNNIQDVVNSVLTQGGLKLSMETGAGVYADIADQCGDFTASIAIEEVEYNGIVLNNMTARMVTETSVSPVYLEQISEDVEKATAPSNGGQGTLPISDMYGYIIDLAFRTNAAESNLLLQVEATDRIYSDNTNPETKGGGSSMTFKATTTDFKDEQVKALMKAIRIVFFNPISKEVIVGARLDVDNTADLTADGWKADMYLCSVTDGTPEADDVIMPLTQNNAAALSVLVYLDGESVGNDDVAATAATSMTGKMNIQFASSASLVPMEYANLHQGTGTGTGTGNNSATAMTAVTAADASCKISSATFTDKTIAVKLADSSDAAITTGTVTFTVADNATAYNATYANGAWSATVTETLAANTAVTVAYTAA